MGHPIICWRGRRRAIRALYSKGMVLVQLDNLSRMYGRFPALRKISLDFIAGRCYVVLGENGAGKSTLLRILAGLLEPTLGTARILSAGKPEKIATNERASAT